MPVLLLLFGCTRHHKVDTTSADRTAQTRTAASQASVVPASHVLDDVPPAIQEAVSPDPERPSPFPELRESGHELVSPKVPAPPISASRSASPSDGRPKPFQLPSPAPSQDHTGLQTIRELPPAPALAPIAESRGSGVPGTQKPCCVASAVYETVRPHRFQRFIEKVPGIRRLQRNNEVGAGFLPPHPLHENTFTLPPGTSPQAFQRHHVDLKASIDEAGSVTRVELLSPKDEELLTLAVFAANGWKFVPARLNDQAVSSQIIIHFWFEDR